MPATTCAGPGCGDPLSELLGGFGSVGLGLTPTNPGLAITVGILHPQLVSFEASVIMPVDPRRNGAALGSSSIAVRLRLLRDPLSASGAAALNVSFRAGLGMVFAQQPAPGLLVGPNVEFLLGMFSIAIRPAILVVSDESDPRSLLPLSALPLFDLSLGLVPRTDPLAGLL